ncbi:aromatic ring-hydroxylating dioxygenase subunit alpha [Novosphingobium sp. KACC 22771]|uniref:aromatic ring-hydroxylating dioxygenase subunit alpha n=1 Tax=Novosphingobium sp. KACC 22771 TaxID=3025670 RepID=UPI002366E53C|nr:aromatic ring-hydroxylating dioxygenase subunit alpha [Novosphingobium sp. KACC 22771]WDF72530.1 aromatic ring-hydroxylating dioxygenase subunit alpha [Novosphingobium sp. KACC 22771]
MSFLHNAWYMAAWADEVEQDKLFSRTILSQPIVFYRDTGGAVRALADRCSHRFVPLSMGRRDGDELQCPYHGLRFGPDGQCVRNPHGDGRIAPNAAIRAYPAHEAGMVIWVWMGDAARADPALIPDCSVLAAAPPSARMHGMLHVAANYQLLSDNIMDLSHVDYLHANTLGGGSISRSTAAVSEAEHSVTIAWQVDSDTVPPAFAGEMPDPSAPARQRTQVVWTAPATMALTIEIERPDDSPVEAKAFHIMTPETATTTHYFYANCRSFRRDDAEYNAIMTRIVTHVFTDEDKPMVEAQQRAMGESDLMDLKPLVLSPDLGAIRARRKLAAMIRAEQARP